VLARSLDNRSDIHGLIGEGLLRIFRQPLRREVIGRPAHSLFSLDAARQFHDAMWHFRHRHDTKLEGEPRFEIANMNVSLKDGDGRTHVVAESFDTLCGVDPCPSNLDPSQYS
jgi:hypothetical protein